MRHQSYYLGLIIVIMYLYSCQNNSLLSESSEYDTLLEHEVRDTSAHDITDAQVRTETRVDNGYVPLSDLKPSQCIGYSGPTYYSKRKLAIYQHMSSESAVVTAVEKGHSVKVIDSRFGDDGWWQVCYDNGFNSGTGWVRKANLTNETWKDKYLSK